MRYIPPKERDTRWPLWCINYECQIPWNHLRSIQDIELFGVPYTGDPVRDRETATELRSVQLPPQRLAELYCDGARILLRNPIVNAKKIYKDIMAHIEAFGRSELANGFSINTRSFPMRDLQKFDEFANALWPMTQATMPADYTTGDFAEVIRRSGQIDRREAFAKMFPETVANNLNAQRLKERQKLSDFFSS